MPPFFNLSALDVTVTVVTGLIWVRTSHSFLIKIFLTRRCRRIVRKIRVWRLLKTQTRFTVYILKFNVQDLYLSIYIVIPRQTQIYVPEKHCFGW
jgi:hypothetical protein